MPIDTHTTPARETLRLPASRRPVPTRTRLRTRQVPMIAYISVLLVLPVVVILGARYSGWWVTTGHTVPSTALGAPALTKGGSGQGSGQGAAQGTGSGEGPSAVIGNPEDVKGSMTVQQVLDAFPRVTAAEIYQLFGVAEDTATSTQLKVLAQKGNGYEVSQLRQWLEERIGPR